VGVKAESFSKERLARLGQIEGWHFWFSGRRTLVRELMNRTPMDHPLHLELGCGTGSMARDLKARGHRVVAVDLRHEGLERSRLMDPSAMLVRADATCLPFRNVSFDVVTALDVLEHLDDDAALLQLHRVLKPGGRMILSVPAMPWLWSARDEDAGHLRRYTPRLLEAALLRARLSVVAIRYYLFILFPLIALSRLLGKGRGGLRARDREEIRIPLVNRLFAWINEAEGKVAAKVSLPWGSSLIAVCTRR
jgi:SAM-dependent methyltransferase